jgi:5'-nucleotidase
MDTILLTNDDGYFAKGIHTLRDALSGRWKTIIVAPDREQSGSSHSLTMHSPLRLDEMSPGVYKADGTPTDCVLLALRGGVANSPAILVSGINHGPNIGDDITYSGTVAAAMEGTLNGIPSIAVSLDGTGNFETAVAVARVVVNNVATHGLPANTLLNVNVPDIPLDELRGIRITSQSSRRYDDQVVTKTDPRGRPYFWIAGNVTSRDAPKTSDFHAVESGFASVTPIQLDLTNHDAIPIVEAWNLSVE